MADDWPGTVLQEITPAAPPVQVAQPQIGMGALNQALVPLIQRESGGKPFVGYTPPGQPLVDLSNAPLDDSGFPIWSGNTDPTTGLRSHAAGILQIQPGTWRPIAQKLGIKDFSLDSQIAVANELHKEQGLTPWQASAGGGWPGASIGAGNWKVDDSAIAFEQGRANTRVVWMEPFEYKQMVQGDKEDVTPSRSLAKSLALGESINDLPDLEVKKQGGRAVVTGQDGLRRAQAAMDAGVQLMPVAIRGDVGDAKELVGMNGKTVPFDYKPVPTVKQPKAPQPPSAWERFATGVTDPLVGLGQASAHLGIRAPEEYEAMAQAGGGSPASTADIDKMVQQREQEYEARRQAGGDTGTDWARLAGNVTSTIPLAALGPAGDAGMLARLAGMAGMGAAGGALAPVTGGDYATEKARQAGLGAATGGVLGAGGEVAARVVAPAIAPAARRLLDAGVRLTPGQMLGGIAKGAEGRLTSIIPTTSGAIRRSIEDFNRVAYDKVLSRIGKAYEGKTVGYDGIDAVEKELSKEYNRILPNINFRADDQFVADLSNLREMASEMPIDENRQFEAILKNRILKRMGREGVMDGQTFKAAESELSQISRGLRRSEVEGQRQLGSAVDELNGTLREAIERQNPDSSEALRRANGAWAAFVRIRDAAANRVKSLGVFTPSDLLTASKRAGGRRVFARGDALMQDLARDAEEVLPSNVPDSGTAGRLLVGELAITGPLAFFANHPEALATLAAGSAAYTSPGVALMRGAAGAGLPATRNFLARSVRGGTNALAPASAFMMPPPQTPQP